MDERLQKVIAHWGIASRRQAEQLILEGRVRLNGAIASLGQKANPELDQIEVDGVLVEPINRPQFIYLLLHKPQGVVSTCQDPQHRTTVLDLLPAEWQSGQGIHPVGRLDADSTGALLLTNDGALTARLTHPRYHIPKTYQVWVQGHPPHSVLKHWQQGILLDDSLTLPARVTVMSHTLTQTLLEIVLWEGRNRQIRRTAEQLGYPVVHLHRTAIGSIDLNPLPSGQYRALTNLEVESLQAEAAMKSTESLAGIKEDSP
ncbi:MAG: pseudouridine synthase [Leptolyngbyaceae bacterium]|nr:pseudouridine synthase [Leptolyngbyaceae bacterium]